MSDALLRAVAEAQRWLVAIYRLELDLRAERFVVEPERARRRLPPDSPRSGVVVVQEPDALEVGIYLDPADASDPGAVVEETSHLLCLAWHAARDLPVSRMLLELQGEVDRYAVARLSGGDGLGHFQDFAWADWMDEATLDLYRFAHRAALGYCRSLDRRYPHRADTPALLSELRRYYRLSPDRKLRAASDPPHRV